MRRRYNLFDHKSGVAHHKPAKRKGLSKRAKAYFVLGAVFVVFAVILVYLGTSFSDAAKNVLDSGSRFSIRDLVTRSPLKQTDGVTNILVMGKGGANHPGGQLTDTMMLVRIRDSDKKIAMVSLPRDLQITIPGNGINKLNAAYSFGWESEKDSSKKPDAAAKAAEKTVESLVGVPVHYCIVVDFTGFKDLVDTLGGVTVDVEKDIYDPMYPKDYFDSNGNYVKTDAYQTFSLEAGKQKLDGTTALKYARSRETSSDFDRAKRQQHLLVAIKNKALSLGVLANPVKVSDMMHAVGDHIKTSFNASELKELLNIATNIDQDKIINKVLDSDPKTGLLVSVNEGGYYLKPKAGNFKEIQAMIKNVFSGTMDTIGQSDVEVWNGSGTKGVAGTLANKLTAAGLAVTKIDTSPEELPETTIYDGTDGSKDLEIVKQKVGQAKVMKYSREGVIKIILGRDYGN